MDSPGIDRYRAPAEGRVRTSPSVSEKCYTLVSGSLDVVAPQLHRSALRPLVAMQLQRLFRRVRPFGDDLPERHVAQVFRDRPAPDGVRRAGTRALARLAVVVDRLASLRLAVVWTLADHAGASDLVDVRSDGRLRVSTRCSPLTVPTVVASRASATASWSVNRAASSSLKP